MACLTSCRTMGVAASLGICAKYSAANDTYKVLQQPVTRCLGQPELVLTGGGGRASVPYRRRGRCRRRPVAACRVAPVRCDSLRLMRARARRLVTMSPPKVNEPTV
jgi:hypothetical protein